MAKNTQTSCIKNTTSVLFTATIKILTMLTKHIILAAINVYMYPYSDVVLKYVILRYASSVHLRRTIYDTPSQTN